MEVDEIQTTKFQRICFNNNSHHDTSSNPDKLATNGVSNEIIVGWPLSRIVRVSRSSGGKDRHSKVITSKGLRDRRVRLSVTTAIQFYDLQDRLGYDQPSKAVEWLIKAAADSIDQLPSLDPCFTNNNNNNNNNDKVSFSISKSSACSSTSETSKGSGLSLSRSENRVRARERARELAAKKEKVKGVSQNSSFTDLLTGGLNSTTVSPDKNNNNSSHDTSPESTNQLNYFQMPLFDGDNNCNVEVQQQRQYHQYSFVHQENSMNFVPGLSSRGTLQSNLVSILPHNNNQVQRFQQPTVDGCTNFSFVMGPTMGAHHQFQANGYDSQRLQLYGGGRDFDHHKERLKN